jgi:hypothetical protein
MLGFSLQAELNDSNILNMLDLAGLPVWQRERAEILSCSEQAPAPPVPSRSPTSSISS